MCQNIPNDPVMLFKFCQHTGSRDYFTTLDLFCENFNVDRSELEAKLKSIDYEYSRDHQSVCMIDTRLSDAFFVETCTHIFPVREILCDITQNILLWLASKMWHISWTTTYSRHSWSFLIKCQINVDMMRFYITGAPARFHLPDCDTGYLHPHQLLILLDQLFLFAFKKYFSASDLRLTQSRS